MNSQHNVEQNDAQASADLPQGKQRWEAPAVTSFKPVTETQGLSYRIGDGYSNLS